MRVTSVRSDATPAASSGGGIAKPAVAATSIPFRLLLSAPAAEIGIDTGKLLRPSPSDSAISGSLELDPANPHLGLVVRWKNPPLPGEHRFAKLTLETPGQETFTHVFDATGDIDDFLELPISAIP